MSRRKRTTNFDIARHIAKLDETATSELVEDALEHLATDDIIDIISAALDDAGKEKLIERLYRDLNGGTE